LDRREEIEVMLLVGDVVESPRERSLSLFHFLPFSLFSLPPSLRSPVVVLVLLLLLLAAVAAVVVGKAGAKAVVLGRKWGGPPREGVEWGWGREEKEAACGSEKRGESRPGE